MCQDIIARVSHDNSDRTQSLIEHSQTVAEIARTIGAYIGLGSLAYLTGILHNTC